MTPAERDALIEAVTSAHRTIDPFTRRVDSHPAFHDLDEAARQIAYERSLATREIECALDPAGLSSTAHAVLARIHRER